MARTKYQPVDVAALEAEYGRLVSYPIAANISGVSVRTLKRFAATGELPVYRVGSARVYRIKVTDLAGLFEPVVA